MIEQCRSETAIEARNSDVTMDTRGVVSDQSTQAILGRIMDKLDMALNQNAKITKSKS